MKWLEAILLGLVQGVTEFLPVSSDGHLKVTQSLLDLANGRTTSGEDALFFDIVLHIGTLLAILIYYRSVAIKSARGLFQIEPVDPIYNRNIVIRACILATIATLPLIPYAILKKRLEAAFESLTITGCGFLVTATALLITYKLSGGNKGPRETKWHDALLIGVAQAFAPLPGVSRSGLTIATALALGLDRGWSVGFSLLIAVPAITGASVFAIKDFDPRSMQADAYAPMIAGAVVAGVVGYFAISWLARVVRGGKLWYYSVYLVFLGVAVIAWGIAGGDRRGEKSTGIIAVDRAPGIERARAGDRTTDVSRRRGVDLGIASGVRAPSP